MTDKVLLIPHIKIHNANALSSPLTIGFPAMTAWLGACHALQRKLQQAGLPVSFDGVGVVCHHLDLQTYKGPGDFEHSIVGTANPVDKDGKRPSFIEEARCHLDASLIIAFSGISKAHGQEQLLVEKVNHLILTQLKIAGGDILSCGSSKPYRDLEILKRKLMPGFALIERRDLMIDSVDQDHDALDTLLENLAVHHTCEQDSEDKASWKSKRKTSGWIVPIATGFQGISALAKAKNQRDEQMPHCFAESIITLGEFIMPYRLNSFNELLWHYRYDEKNHLYLCEQRYATKPSTQSANLNIDLS